MAGSPAFGVITALPREALAVRHVLEEIRPVAGDHNRYLLGRAGCGDVVVTSLTNSGNVEAAGACAHLVQRFPSVRAVVMCGIALGVPCPGHPEKDVRLGDVVVGSAGVIHYSHRRVTADASTLRGAPMPASPLLLRGVRELQIEALRGSRPWERHLATPPDPSFARPSASGQTPAPRARSEVFYGRIGSGDLLLRDATARDAIVGKEELLAIEMEGAGVAGAAASVSRECLVVRGVSDYGDKRKSDLWQSYAALAAASYLRALLDALAPAGGPSAGPGGERPSLLDLVLLMECVPSLQTPSGRNDVLQVMTMAESSRAPIAVRVARDDKTRLALLSLARVCDDSGTGFPRLLEALTYLEGEDSRTVRELADAIARYRS